MRTETTLSPSMRGQAAAPGLVRRAIETYTRVFNRLAETNWSPRRLLVRQHAAAAAAMLAIIPSWWTLAWSAGAAIAALAERKGGKA